MKKGYPRRGPPRPDISEDGIVGEILEDIECLRFDGSDSEHYDDLNDDTFGGGAESTWDPTETFQLAEKEEVCVRVRREPRELVKSELFDFPESRVSPRRSPRKQRNYQDNKSYHGSNRRGEGHSHSSQQGEPEEIDRSGLWESDLASYRRLGFYNITPHLMELVAHKQAFVPTKWKISQWTLDRHVKGVKRSKHTSEKEMFMSEQAFDQILRIHLTQICKDPRLQNYTGRWNTRHLGIKPRTASPREAEEPSTSEQQNGINHNRFGRSTFASVRHGRRLIQLNNFIAKPQEGPVPKERQLRETIEFGYEALYMLCDIEEEIEQCPMNHVAALDKMQKDREGRLNQLFVSLTTGSNSIEDIMGLNKGRQLMIKLGKKLSIETKIQLACRIIGCYTAFLRICQEVESLFAEETSLIELIVHLSSSTNLKPLVAFEREDYESYEGIGPSLQQRLFQANSYTQCFLFILECLTLGGHLFLLTSDTGGRQTALQKCCTMLLNSEQDGNFFSMLLLTRGGVIFLNVVLERICQNPIAVDKGIVDMILHYTLETSESITSHGHEWQSLAATIMRLFR